MEKTPEKQLFNRVPILPEVPILPSYEDIVIIVIHCANKKKFSTYRFQIRRFRKNNKKI